MNLGNTYEIPRILCKSGPCSKVTESVDLETVKRRAQIRSAWHTCNNGSVM